MSSFHSAADFGCVFQIGCSGAPITACIAGLTSAVGSGMSRAGVLRMPPSSAIAAPDAMTKAAASSARCRVFIFMVSPPRCGAVLVPRIADDGPISAAPCQRGSSAVKRM